MLLEVGLRVLRQRLMREYHRIRGRVEIDVCSRDSAVSSSNLPLLRLEPILRRNAEERNPNGIFFSTGVTDWEETEDHVLVTVKKADGNTATYRTQYVAACDGGKMSTKKLGIKMEGLAGIIDFVSTHFKADLSDYWDGEHIDCFGCTFR
jgi:2,4-dichlorophenol 6-monooxygenase